MVAWPGSLPTQPLADTHQQTGRPNVVTFEPEAGEPIRGERYTGVSFDHAFDFVVDATQKATLFNFWHDTCKQGVLPFDADFVDGETRTYWFREPPSVVNIRGSEFYRVSIAIGGREVF